MRYLSVCSGIEAASRAWHQLGWTPVAFAEIEKFPCAYLEATYPGVPNLGDMTRFEQWPALDVDLLVGGTPCQAFSVAGQRRSLEDERGNLTLVFCRIADRFDPEVILWENVPGVLSTPDNAFGCFLAELAGCDTPIPASRLGWSDAGVVSGPRRTIAWRVIDSQGFVPQRRSRVFVVAIRAGSRLHPADVLFETEAQAFEHLGERAYTGPLFPLPEGVRGDSAAGEEAGKDVAAPLRSGPAGGRSHGKVNGTDRATLVAHALRADGHDASEDGTGRGTPLVVATAEGGVSVNLTRSNIGKQIHNQSPLLVFAAKDYESGEFEECGDSTRPITTSTDRSRAAPIVAFSCKDHGADAGELAPTLRAMPHAGSHANAGGQIAVAVQEAQTGVREYATAGALRADGPGHDPVGTRIREGMMVRRLTPLECERLMGQPDNATLIEYRGKPAADGPRYKALGNSKVVDVVLWIGQRIEMVTNRSKA